MMFPAAMSGKHVDVLRLRIVDGDTPGCNRTQVLLVVFIAGYWKGTLVAVKTMMFPAAMSGKEKREKMAIMETAISASLSHPNIVQVGSH
jgi:hypothetical protein